MLGPLQRSRQSNARNHRTTPRLNVNTQRAGVVLATPATTQDSPYAIRHVFQMSASSTNCEEVELTYDNGHEILGQSPAIEAYLAAQPRPSLSQLELHAETLPE